MSSNYSRAQKPIYEPRHLKVICIGAGASGLLLSYKLQRSFEHFNLTIYEKNERVSGTWYENTYPGCGCDVPAHVYSFSFEPNPNWSSVYAGSKEIREYFSSFCEKYKLGKYIKLRHQVSQAVWDDKRGQWDVEVTNLADGTIIRDSCDILVNATGVLNAWRWPNIPGLQDFKGKRLHTAQWDSSVDLKGKHVGLIGNGSSAIQVLPAILPHVSKITTFIRTPTWICPDLAIESRSYSNEERQKFNEDPQALLEHRKQLEAGTNSSFSLFMNDSDVQRGAFENLSAMMKDKLQGSALQDILIPKWPVGCRRLTPGISYLESLTSERVDVVYGNIERITERGCVSSNGQEYPVDVLICATGFDTSYKPRFPIIGHKGQNLAEVWKDEPRSYFGIAAHDFPNYFMFLGPNSPVGNGAVLIGMEAQADYILNMINRWQTENIHSFSPKAAAVNDFIAFKDEFMKRTVWNHACSSWYKSNSVSGKVTALWPGSTLHYLEAMTEPRYEDWDFEYVGNRFAFFGNGFSQTESDETADLAYYVRMEDDAPYVSRVKQIRVTSRSGSVCRGDGGKQEHRQTKL
ncbi:FAD/NAD(P)-binding domain-containing protein [Pholiota conissans]|uniref:FAD/NAD(P)-binding domain-containing protein n=1 Tax=Pholiota conissans TaxID=109636 RepID=A0A9P5ZFE7_9AGAR|nr:FAD/NAD(P)-binding domain-containing protein [Pholiota conissans]